MNIAAMSSGVDPESGDTNGTNQTLSDRPSQWVANIAAPSNGVPERTAQIASNHTPENVSQVVKTRPKSMPHSAAAIDPGKRLAHPALVWRGACRSEMLSQRISRANTSTPTQQRQGRDCRSA